MKNSVLWIILIIFALVIGFLLGYIVGTQNPTQSFFSPSNSTQSYSENSLQAVGSYKTDSWNGKSAALVIKNDGTCLYPTRASGTWTQDEQIITISLNGKDSVHTAELVEGGIILHGTFFDKVN